MNIINIKNIYGKTIYQCEARTFKEAVEKAIKAKVDLSYANLRFADLSFANLSHINLSFADLSHTNLRFADLSYVNLSYANLFNANLSYANLSCANLNFANLNFANLNFANLRFANLVSTNLKETDLRYTNLSKTNLKGTNLEGANLSKTDLAEIKTDNRYVQVACIGSRKGVTTYCFEEDRVWCGCFTGSLKEFEQQCIKTHANNPQYLNEYIGFINYINFLKKNRYNLSPLDFEIALPA